MYWFIFIVICLHSASSISTGRIEYLPGFEGPLPFYLETSYVGVDVNEDVQLFYYFIRSESNPQEDPLMLWLTGGPGCSSISGLLYENGPLQFEAVPYNGSLPRLILRTDSWTKIANIIFLDIPVGTGFSYARTSCASHSNIILYSEHAHEFIRKWLESHREFISNPFYIGGDSYSGNPIPILTQLISNVNEEGMKPYINLKGYVLGNPATFPNETNYEVQFANGMGLISDEHYKSLFHSCHGEYRPDYIEPNNIECVQNLQLYMECIEGINKYQILEHYCGENEWPLEIPSEIQFEERQNCSGFYCRIYAARLSYYWVNDVGVREALHIKKGSIGEWIRCSDNQNYNTTEVDVRLYHLNLSSQGYRSLIYSGDHDMVIPHQSTQAWIKDLNYSVVDQWRSWKVNGQIAGYTESYSNGMTFATVKGAGHTAPEYKPAECFMMFKRWVTNQPL